MLHPFEDPPLFWPGQISIPYTLLLEVFVVIFRSVWIWIFKFDILGTVFQTCSDLLRSYFYILEKHPILKVGSPHEKVIHSKPFSAESSLIKVDYGCDNEYIIVLFWLVEMIYISMHSLTIANWRPIFPIVTPPEKKMQGSHDRTYRKSGSVYLKQTTNRDDDYLALINYWYA